MGDGHGAALRRRRSRRLAIAALRQSPPGRYGTRTVAIL
jgi:hypothetical protein